MMIESKGFIVTGIGTDVGKTIVAAILTKALEAVYWKPIQSGAQKDSDAAKVFQLTSNSATIHEGTISLQAPLSPHIAAQMEGIEIDPAQLRLPPTEKFMIIEGAGGLMVPINTSGVLFLDVFEIWSLPLVLVVRHYLGSINHTLLSLSEIKRRGLQLEGVVYVGEDDFGAEEIIHNLYYPKVLAKIPLVEKVDQLFIEEQAIKVKLQNNW